MDQLAEGVVGVPEFPSDLLLGPAIEEDGAEGLVAAMQRAGGLGEEVVAAGVVHHRAPDVSFLPCEIRSSGEFTPGLQRGHGGGGPGRIAGNPGDPAMWGCGPRQARHRGRGPHPRGKTSQDAPGPSGKTAEKATEGSQVR
jgi:hypothetical protein